MNYRHAFHAGNHADVLKHIVQLALIDSFKRKDSPFFVLDTHGGAGRYLLASEESRKTLEAEEGVMRLMAPLTVRHRLQPRRYASASPIWWRCTTAKAANALPSSWSRACLATY